MNTERILSAGIALVVVTALGLSAATLSSTMSTDPADAVDVDWDALPVGDDSEGDIMAAAEGAHDRYTGGDDGDASGGSDADGTDAQSSAEDGGSEASGGESDREGQDQRSGSGQDDVAGDGQGDSRDQRAGDGPDDQASASSTGEGWVAESWPRLLALLLAVLLAVVAVAYRYRRALGAALGSPEEGRNESLIPDPQNDVERAWAELVDRTGVSRPRTRTPRDCARLAVETGYDPALVGRLRRAFEDVRYGPHAPTAEQASAAREALEQLDGETA